MGNLYTHLVKKNDPRIEVLSKLKQAWRSTPRDFKVIEQLQKELKRIETNKKKKIPQRKKLKSAFDWVINKAR